MKSWKVSGLPLIWISVLVFILDQVTKTIATDYFSANNMGLYEPIPVLPFFNFTLAHNEGAAFSFLADAGGWQRWLFTGIASLVSAFIVVWMFQNNNKQRWLNVALAFILGGALGNLYDRVAYGYVIDFLDFYWGTSHFPAFNIADSAISVGAFMLFIDMFFQEQPEQTEANDKNKRYKEDQEETANE